MKPTLIFTLSLVLGIAALVGCGERLSKVNPLAADPPAGFTVPVATPTPMPCVGCVMLADFNAGTPTTNAAGPVDEYDDTGDGCGPSTSGGVRTVVGGSHDGTNCMQFTFQVGLNAGCGYQYTTLNFGSSPLAGFSAIRFWIKGAVGGEDINVKLRNPGGSQNVRVRLSAFHPITSTWQDVRIPFSAFPVTVPPLNTSLTASLDFIEVSPVASQTIFIDDVRWEP